MSLKSFSFLFLFLFLSLIVAVFPKQVSADGEILIQPSKEDITANPGDKILKSLLIVNSSQKPLTLKVSVRDVRVLDETGKIDFYIGQSSSSALSWIIPQYNVISIPALDSKKMQYIVSVDKNMQGRGYSGAIIFQLYNADKNITDSNTFGTIINLNVLAKGITAGGTISSFSSPFFQFRDPSKFSFKIYNPGNSNLSASGKITFTNIFGKNISEFDSGLIEVSPGMTKNFDYAWNNSPLFGIYKGQVSLTNSLRQDNKISGSAWFIFIPFQKVLPALLGLFAIIIFSAGAYALRTFTKPKRIRIAVHKIKI